MIIETCVVGVMSTNCYLLINETRNEAVVIDPGAQPELIKTKLEEFNVTPMAILLTHGHFDHIMAAFSLAKEYDIKIHAGRPEERLLADASLNCSSLVQQDIVLETEVLLDDREILNLAGINIEVIYTPGHTKGGVSYYIEDQGVLFCGDTLFYESIGRTDLPTGDIRSLLYSIEQHLFVLPEDVVVYPGHGQATSIGHEKVSNPFTLEYR